MVEHMRTAGRRIKALRTKKDLTQRELAEEFSRFIGRRTSLTSMAISSWETGRKLPPAETLIWLADFFQVSVDYILGRAEMNSEVSKSAPPHLDRDFEIPVGQLELYDQEPVYIVSPQGVIESQWGIVDYPRRVIVLADRRVSLNKNLKYYISRRQSDISLKHTLRYSISMEDLLKGEYDTVYVKSLAPDERLRGALEGWYHLDAGHEMLISNSGRALSLEGLSVFFNVYAPKSVLN